MANLYMGQGPSRFALPAIHKKSLLASAVLYAATAATSAFAGDCVDFTIGAFTPEGETQAVSDLGCIADPAQRFVSESRISMWQADGSLRDAKEAGFCTGPTDADCSGAMPSSFDNLETAYFKNNVGAGYYGAILDKSNGFVYSNPGFATDLREPAAHVSGLSANAEGNGQIKLTWTDVAADADPQPTGYMVYCQTSNSFTDPANGTMPANAACSGTGAGVWNIAQGAGGMFIWTGLDDNTEYFFRVVPYSNSGIYSNYKTAAAPTASATATGTAPSTGKIDVPLGSDQWSFTADSTYSFEDYTDTEGTTYPAINMVKTLGFVKNANFTNGTIEFDTVFSADSSESKKDETGLIWRAQSEGDYELMHFRDYEFGTPYGMHYMPVNDTEHPLQLYYGPGHNPVNVDKPLGVWTHVKVVVSGTEGEVFVGDMDKPALYINDMKQGIQTGWVGLFGGYNVPPAVRISSYAANFSYESMDSAPALVKGDAVQEVANLNDPNMVTEWAISDVFSSKDLEGKTRLTANDVTGRSWDKLPTDNVGVAFISKIRNLDRVYRSKNTVFARITIDSDKAQLKKLMFGFTDSAQVYFNGDLIYSGSDAFRSRDYRFLGTIGFFDNLYLPLQPGKNELWLAVTDFIAGWGHKAKFENLDGISVSTTTDAIAPNPAATLTADVTDNDCLAAYKDGVVSIPCVSVPMVNQAGENERGFFSVNLNQQPGSFDFALDPASVKAYEAK